ncbi:Rmf/CrpP family protein [Burkholderia ubonensis]|uniref:ribosome modulation factor n=1 Tax=Burkholderia ubonensis TaxID=101571 RepID=UPI000A6F95FC|nr:Rmf/CrpP family protein [Burkholderia ubonensis]
MLQAVAAIATAETDAEIAQRERMKGAEAARAGKQRDDCPWTGGLCERWWLEGFDNPVSASTVRAL